MVEVMTEVSEDYLSSQEPDIHDTRAESLDGGVLDGQKADRSAVRRSESFSSDSNHRPDRLPR
jgi:hypothetical protein